MADGINFLQSKSTGPFVHFFPSSQRREKTIKMFFFFLLRKGENKLSKYIFFSFYFSAKVKINRQNIFFLILLPRKGENKPWKKNPFFFSAKAKIKAWKCCVVYEPRSHSAAIRWNNIARRFSLIVNRIRIIILT